MYLGGPADNPNRQRHLDRANEIALGITLPGCERGITAAARRVGMRPSLDGAPIVARGHQYRIDPVQNAFVVGRRAIWIDGRKGIRPQDAFDYLFATNTVALKRAGRHNRARAR